MELRTPRLLLRPYTMEDVTSLLQAKTDSHQQLKTWMVWAQNPPTLVSEETTIKLFHKKQEEGTEYTFAITSLQDTYLGSIGYIVKDPDVPGFEIGYWLSTPHTGMGYMQEATHLLTEYLFTVKKAQRVFIRCIFTNTRSAAVAKSLGFPHEGRLLNKRRHVDDTIVHEDIFAHTPESWQTFLAKP